MSDEGQEKTAEEMIQKGLSEMSTDNEAHNSDGDNVGPNDNQEPSYTEGDYRAKQEEIARSKGWVPIEEWKEDPSKWRSAEVFNVREEFIGDIRKERARSRDLEKNFDERLNNVNKLYDLQIKQLESKRDDAIDLADKDQVLEIQGQIDDMKNQQFKAPVKNVDPQDYQQDVNIVNDWNSKNSWIMNDDDPRTPYAKHRFASYLNKNLDTRSAIAAVENDIRMNFPKVNPARTNRPIPEGGTKPGNRSQSESKITMADLTRDELSLRSIGAWDTEEEFLQAVQDSRKEG